MSWALSLLPSRLDAFLFVFLLVCLLVCLFIFFLRCVFVAIRWQLLPLLSSSSPLLSSSSPSPLSSLPPSSSSSSSSSLVYFVLCSLLLVSSFLVFSLGSLFVCLLVSCSLLVVSLSRPHGSSSLSLLSFPLLFSSILFFAHRLSFLPPHLGSCRFDCLSLCFFTSCVFVAITGFVRPDGIFGSRVRTNERTNERKKALRSVSEGHSTERTKGRRQTRDVRISGQFLLDIDQLRPGLRLTRWPVCSSV